MDHGVWRFKVTGKRLLNKQTVFTVSVESVGRSKKTGPTFLLDIDASDMSLNRLIITRAGRQAEVIDSDSRALFLEPQLTAALPLDFSPLPVFHIYGLQRQRELTQTQTKIFHDGGATVYQLANFSRKTPGERGVDTLEIEMGTSAAGADSLRTLQSWESDKPWWTGAKRWRRGILESEAILVEF